jgi:hypothetical protein
MLASSIRHDAHCSHRQEETPQSIIIKEKNHKGFPKNSIPLKGLGHKMNVLYFRAYKIKSVLSVNAHILFDDALW